MAAFVEGLDYASHVTVHALPRLTERLDLLRLISHEKPPNGSVTKLQRGH